MSRRAFWTVGFLALTAAAVGMEIYAAADGNADTPTWSELIGAYVPQTIGVGAAGILAAWIVPHISAQYRSEGGAMKYAKFIVALLTAVLTAGSQALPLTPEQQGWVTIGLTLLGAVGVYLVPNKPSAEGAVRERSGPAPY